MGIELYRNNINYKKYVNQLINIMYDYDTRFQIRVRRIGIELNNLGGSQALFKALQVLIDELNQLNYTDDYLSYLREIEFAWSNINDNFQA